MAFRRATLLFCITTIVLGVNFDLNSDGNRYQTEMTRLILSEKSPPEPLLHSVPISSLLEEALSERNRPMYRSHVLPKLAWHRRTVVTELFLGFEGAERERPFTSGGRLMLFSSSSTSTLSTVYPSMMALHDGTVRKSQFRGCSRSTHQTKKTNTLEDVRPCLYKEQEEVFAEMHNSSNRHEIEMSCLSTCSLNLEMSTPGQRYSTVNATDTICTLEPHHNTVENSIILPSGQCKDRLRNTSIPDLDSKDSDTDSHYFCKTTNRSLSKICRLVRGCFTESSTSKLKKDFSIASLVFTFAISKSKVRHRLKQTLTAMFNGTSVRQLIQTAMKGQNHINEKWKSNFEDNTPLWKALSTFTPPPPVYRVVAPATSFLPEMGSSGKDNMAHLGCRLASLAALPPSCNVSRTRLAQAGFYYDSSKATRDGNNAHGVVCFSCGIAVARWEAGDNPMVVHRRLKPDCAHILSQGPDVFPSDPAPSVHGSGPSSISSLSTFSTDSSLSSLSSMSSWSSTSSISSDSSQASSILGRAGSQEGAQSSGYSDLATDCAAIAPSPLAPDHVTAPSQYAPSRQAHSSFPSRITRNLNSPDDTDDRPQLSMDSAVYPQFSTISERLATYQGWPLGRYFKPDDLVYDGFYYAGYADCLRCFYCGVGLKSWDRNDSVMDEHIRWRPTCGYILAVKGRRFVNQTLQRLRANIPDVDGELTTTQSNRDFVDRARNGPLVPSSSLSGNGSGQESHSTQGNTSSNEAVEAARVMGFSEDVIARALRDLQQPDASTIDKQTFIEYVMSLTTVVDGNETSTSAAGANETSDLNTDGPSAVAAAEPLRGRAQEVVRENERLRSMKTCKICNTGTVGVIFLPCGHLVACTDCAGRTRNCTRCGQYIRATANVYLS